MSFIAEPLSFRAAAARRKAHWDEVYREKSPLEVSWYLVLAASSTLTINADSFWASRIN